MSDAIEEIGRQQGDKRNEAMEAWAAMIYSQNRNAEHNAVQETAGCGGSSVPKETYVPTDAKKIAKLKEVKAAQDALRAEAARTQDTVVKGTQQAQPIAEVPPQVEAREAKAKVQEAQQTRETRQTTVAKAAEKQEVREQAEVAQEEAVEAATHHHPDIEMPATLGNTKESADMRATAMASTGTKSPDQMDRAKEPEPVVEVDSPEQAALLAAIKSGAGATPDLVAKAYVQAAGMEGVKGTLQEGLLQGFVVAL